MGTYTINGFHTHLPITENENVVAFFCLYKPEYICSNEQGMGGKLTPISLPIFGKYDGEGSIKDVVKDENVRVIEKVFDKNIESILLKLSYSPGINVSLELRKYFHIDVTMGENMSNWKIVLCMEHIFFYDWVKKQTPTLYRYENIDKWINEGIEKEKELGYLNGQFKELLHKSNIYYNEESVKIPYVYEHNFNPIYNDGFYRNTGLMDSSNLLSLYSNNKDVYEVLFDKMRKEYIEFIIFISNMNLYSWKIDFHKMATQDPYNTIGLYDEMLEYMKNKF